MVAGPAGLVALTSAWSVPACGARKQRSKLEQFDVNDPSEALLLVGVVR